MKEPLNFSTFASNSGGVATFRLLGFGVMFYHLEGPLFEQIDPKVYGVDIWPGWRFSFVYPWT